MKDRILTWGAILFLIGIVPAQIYLDYQGNHKPQKVDLSVRETVVLKGENKHD